MHLASSMAGHGAKENKELLADMHVAAKNRQIHQSGSSQLN
jgi:hypothetical protein